MYSHAANPGFTEPILVLGREQAIMAGAACTAEPAPHAQAPARPAPDSIGFACARGGKPIFGLTRQPQPLRAAQLDG